MAVQGEREQGGLEIDVELDEPMVQDTREEDTLPQGWEKRLCHASGYFYYYNCTTERGQWMRPGHVTMQQLMAVMDLAMKRKDWSLGTMADDVKMLREFADGTRTLPERNTESRGSVAAVRTTITGEEELTEKIMMIGREVYELAQLMTSVSATTIIGETKKTRPRGDDGGGRGDDGDAGI